MILVSSFISVLSLGLVPEASAHGLGWVDQFGSVQSDAAWSVVVMGGAIYVAGDTNGHLSGKTSRGGSDTFLVKYDAAGEKVWARQFGTAGLDEASGVAADATGIYVTGITDGAFPGENPHGSLDGFLRKYTPAGDTVWTVQFGTKQWDPTMDVAVGPGGVAVTGYTYGAFGQDRNHGSLDGFLMQFDTSGSRLWVRQFGSSKQDSPLGVTADAHGIVVGGYTLGALAGQTLHGGSDAFAMAFAPDGSRRWQRQFGTHRSDAAYGLTVFGDVVYVGGTSRGSLAGQRDHGGSDAFLRAYDETGSGLWTRQLGSDRADAATAVAADITGIYLAGVTFGRLAHQSDLRHADGFVRGFDQTGSGMWTTQFGSSDYDLPLSASVDGAGTVYVAGLLDGAMPTQTSLGDYDAFLAHVS